MENVVKRRYEWIDALRSLAIYLMIIFHFSYDLDVFGHVDIDFLGDPFWLWFPCVIVFLFLLTVGFSLREANPLEIRWNSYFKRVGKIAICAIGVSIMTYVLFPKSWVYFGTLHNIALNSLLAIPFIHRPKLALGVAIMIFVLELLGVPWPWLQLPHASMDYIPPLPWLMWVLLGIYLHSVRLHHIPTPSASWWRYFIWPGKHSLVIYLTHQAVLYGVVWAYTILTN